MHSLTEDFKTIDELERDARALVDQVHRTGRPVIVTSQGKPDVVLVDAATYEQRLRVLNLAELLAEGEESIRAGKTIPIEQAEAELFGEKKTQKVQGRAQRGGVTGHQGESRLHRKR